MTSSPPRPPPRLEMGKLHLGLATAADAQLAQVVAMVDSLEERGAADDVIAPLRPRLAYLRPRRPLRFCRLLFMPLDPVIVPAAQWDAGSPTLPRTALAPLAAMVRTQLGAESTAIEARIRGSSVDDIELALLAGSELWPQAAAVFTEATEVPPGWARTGLPPEICMTVMRMAGVVLAQAEALQGLFAEVEIGVSLRPELLESMIAAVAPEGRNTLAIIAALVLARLPEAHKAFVQAGRVLGREGSAFARSAVDQAVEVLLGRLEIVCGVEGLVVGSSLSQAGAEIRRIGLLLDCLRAGYGTDHTARIAAIERRLDASCRLRFGTAMKTEFARALLRLDMNSDAAALAALEDTARGLHDLRREARTVGSPELYDTLLQQAAAMVKVADRQTGLGLVDRVRLVEILVGPEEALAMLEPTQGGDPEPA